MVPARSRSIAVAQPVEVYPPDQCEMFEHEVGGVGAAESTTAVKSNGRHILSYLPSPNNCAAPASATSRVQPAQDTLSVICTSYERLPNSLGCRALSFTMSATSHHTLHSLRSRNGLHSSIARWSRHHRFLVCD